MYYADDIFINKAKNDPIIGRIASNLVDKNWEIRKSGCTFDIQKKFSSIGILNESHIKTKTIN